jgi:hypothetical protein
MKKTYIFIIILCILAFLLITIAFFASSNKNGSALNEPTPTPSATNIPAPRPTGTAIPNSIPKIIPSTYPQNTVAISVLIEKLPHYESYFSLSYDFSADSFLLTLSTNESATGEAAFEKYLKQNNILDKSWLQNLTTNYP